MKVHVVMGSTGEYSDRTDWAVCAYLNEKTAQDHVERASRRAGELLMLRGDHCISNCEEINEHDPDAPCMDYTGTTYSIMAVEVRDAE